MTTDQIVIFSVLGLILVLFIWGRWRYDLVALFVLLLLTVVGLVSPEEAFSGFGHPAVITVAAVLIVSRALFNSGVVDYIVRLMSRAGDNYNVQILILVLAITISSGFMNNIGALALFMPVALRMARKSERSPSLYLMPLSFGSLLGGLITQVGTPPNIIISIFRTETEVGIPFRMFDFAPVGAGIALAGVLFIVLLGWRLIPRRKGQLSAEEIFKVEDYITEVVVPEKSALTGKRIRDLENMTDGDVAVVGHIRKEQKFAAPSPYRTFQENDRLIIKADAEELQELLNASGLEIADSEKLDEEALSSEEIIVIEATITTNSVLERRTARGMKLRSRYGVNLLGLAREGGRLRSRPDRVRLRAGDVLLLQGPADIIYEVLPTLGLLPLVERGLRIDQPPRTIFGVLIFAAALVMAALGYLSIQVAFTAAALVMVLAGFLSLREIYDSVDWPIIVLLGAMLPVSQALENTGGAELLAGGILSVAGNVAPWITLTIIMVGTMFLSNLVNNAAAAVLMAPIAISVAAGLQASSDPFLMAVAVGASCAFLTPIGHQSNTLVMGPGGYKFGDYWRMGLPLEIIIVLVGVPLIMIFWPFGF
ncbi:MAG: potassium transporter TrkA [Firmicutes bacterium ML8_F2]|nr:MAG: potassium transporter TrkA [Firmicutes bacterium ML8_F2]